MALISLSHADRLARASVLLTAAGFLLQIIALAAPYWRSSDSRHEGLWEVCVDGACTRLYSSDTLGARLINGVDGWFQAVEVLETIGLIFSFGALFIGVLYACVPAVSSKVVAGWSIVTSFVAAVVIIAGVIIYSGKTTNRNGLELSWSFGLAVVSGALHCLVAILLMVILRRQRPAEDV